MTIQQVVFILISALTLLSAVVVVTDRNLFRAAISLMVSFLGVAGLYVILEAGFLAVAQLIVYIGAISILIIFAIMMTRRMMQTVESPFNPRPVSAVIAGVAVAALLIVIAVSTWPDVQAVDASPDVLRGSVAEMGRLLVSPEHYVVPFELASVLLLAALIGAVAIARPEKDS